MSAAEEWVISASMMQDIDLTHTCGYRVEIFDAGRDDWPTLQKVLDLIAAHDCPVAEQPKGSSPEPPPTHDGPCVRSLDGDGKPLSYCALCYQDMPGDAS